jgi:hypothetical protein
MMPHVHRIFLVPKQKISAREFEYRVRTRAYMIWRYDYSCQEGRALDDWLKAEEEVASSYEVIA